MRQELARKLSKSLSVVARQAAKMQKVIVGSQPLPAELKKKEN